MIFCHVQAAPMYTSSNRNNRLHFRLALLAVNDFLRGGGSSRGILPGIYNTGCGRVGDSGRNDSRAGGKRGEMLL